MEMSNTYMPELHVAQQRRRDKLRVQQLHEFHTINNFHNHQNNNTSSLVFPSEMFTFPATTQSSTFPDIHPSRFVASSTSNSCDPQSLLGCENWVMNNCNNTSSELSAAHQYYQNNSSVQNWEHGGGNELALLPSFVSHPSDAHTLSLSLSSSPMSEMQQRLGELPDVKPNLVESGSISSVVKYGNNQIEANGVGSSNHHMVRNVGPLGPFTGYTTILKSSKFLKPAQQLLDEFLSVTGLRHVRASEEVESVTTSRSRSIIADCGDVLGSKDRNSCGLSVAHESYRPDCHEKKANLIHMQEEVCKRHMHYHQQMEMVIAAFNAVPGLSNATPYISCSLRIISRHFRCVKNAIAEQIKNIKKVLGEDLSSPTSFMKGESSSSRFDHSFAKVKSGPVGGTGFAAHQNHVWRPQRGLPERAVSVLRAWLFDHFLHPYPTDTDKQMLASQTGLSRNQVSNWFINARVRLWKPMVEEIHTLETKGMSRSETNSNKLAVEYHIPDCKQPVNEMHDTRQSGSSSCMEGSSRGETNAEQLLQKCSRVEHHPIPSSVDGSFISFLPYQRQGLELGGMGSVSLTLGLRHGSETTHQQQLQHTFQQQGMHFGGQVMHDFSG